MTGPAAAERRALMEQTYNDSPACRVQKLADDLYCLEEVGLVNLYLLRGSERALLVDTGYGYTDYRPLIRAITDLPLIVVNTHGDPDHALGSYLFPVVYLGEEDYEGLLANDDADFKRGSVQFRYTVLPAVKGLIDEDAYCASTLKNTEFRFLKEGDTLDLGGGQIVEVYDLPGHSNGSRGLLDVQNRRFFTGDVITFHNIWNFGSLERCSFRKMMRTFRKAQALAARYDGIYPAHGPKPLPPRAVDELIEGLYDLRDNHAEDEEFSNALSELAGPGVRKFTHAYKHALFRYSEEGLRDMLEHGLEE